MSLHLNTTDTRVWQMPVIENPNPAEATLLKRIHELTLQLSQTEGKNKELLEEKEHSRQAVEKSVSRLQNVLSYTGSVMKKSYTAIHGNLSAEEKSKAEKELESVIIKIDEMQQTISGGRKKGSINLEELNMVNPVDSHCNQFEAQKKALDELYNTHLRPTGSYSNKDIADKLGDWEGYFMRIQVQLSDSKAYLFNYIVTLRKYIDYLDSHPIQSENISAISQYLNLLDADMITRLQFDVTDMSSQVESTSKSVKEQIKINQDNSSKLKIRHDKVLKQYIQVTSLVKKIELRLSKFTHHISAHPAMLVLKEDSTHFLNDLNGLMSRLENNQSSLFSLVNELFKLLIAYNGKNPLKDDRFPDPKFKEKLENIEKQWTASGLKFMDDPLYPSFINGTAKLPEKGLFERAQSMKSSAAVAESKLRNLLKDFETNAMIDSLFSSMAFYDQVEQDQLKKEESSAYHTELNDIKDLLAIFSEGWKTSEKLFSTLIPTTLNKLCSSIMTNQGAIRSGVVYFIKGSANYNTNYVLPPF